MYNINYTNNKIRIFMVPVYVKLYSENANSSNNVPSHRVSISEALKAVMEKVRRLAVKNPSSVNCYIPYKR